MTDRSELLGELSRQFGLALDVLSAKSLSYDADGDCLANVRAAARLTGLTPVEVALYWLAKHIATLFTKKGRVPDEVLADIHNYLAIVKVLSAEQ